MARVVQQRTSPPYLLIIMVFLFLIVATLSILSYMKSSDLNKQLTKSNKTLGKLASSDDLRDGQIQKMMSRYDERSAGEGRKTVVKQFQSQVSDLSRYATGQESDAEVAIAQADAALEKIGGSRGLIGEALGLYAQNNAMQQQLMEKNKLLADRQKQIEGKDRTIEAISRDLEARITALQDKGQSRDRDFTDQHQSYKADLDEARRDWEKKREELSDNVSAKIRVIQRLELEKQRLQARIGELLKRIEQFSKPKGGEIELGLKPDGKILRVTAQGKICYINLGAKDRVKPGLTFSVYSPAGIPEDGKGKATIIVSSVGEIYSECRVQEQQKGDLISPDDLVANLAFDPTRTYTFVVEGEFDIYGTGRPTVEGAKEAAVLIRRYGGTVAEKINIDTDFVVIGSEPMPPAEPSPNDPLVVWQSYRNQVAVYNRYEEVKKLADSMHIPVLNTNKFLSFIGYMPTGAD